MPSPPPALARLLGSRQRADLLSALVREPDRAWTVRGLAEASGADYKSAWSEVQAMLEIDLLCHVGGGKRRKLQWNRQHPAAAHLTGLAGELDGRGVPATLRRVLRHLRGVEVAVHFGSRARGTHRGDSDVDVLVVGDVDAAEAHACALELEKQFDVAVDLHVMSREEYERQRAEPLSFVHGILAAPHLVLVA